MIRRVGETMFFGGNLCGEHLQFGMELAMVK
jgi:hypothetical protein